MKKSKKVKRGDKKSGKKRKLKLGHRWQKEKRKVAQNTVNIQPPPFQAPSNPVQLPLHPNALNELNDLRAQIANHRIRIDRFENRQVPGRNEQVPIEPPGPPRNRFERSQLQTEDFIRRQKRDIEEDNMSDLYSPSRLFDSKKRESLMTPIFEKYEKRQSIINSEAKEGIEENARGSMLKFAPGTGEHQNINYDRRKKKKGGAPTPTHSEGEVDEVQRIRKKADDIMGFLDDYA